MQDKMIYSGFNQDAHGMTMLGRVVMDAWLFDLIPRDEDCTGWNLNRMQILMDKVTQSWDAYGSLPSRLPPDLQQRHAELYAWAAERGRSLGWNPELGDDD